MSINMYSSYCVCCFNNIRVKYLYLYIQYIFIFQYIQFSFFFFFFNFKFISLFNFLMSIDLHNDVCDIDLLLDEDNDLTNEEKCEYFLISPLPEFQFSIYMTLLQFFWGGFSQCFDAAACFLKVIKACPLELVLEIVPLELLLATISEDLNPIFASILIYLRPVFDQQMYPLDCLIEAATTTESGFIFVRLLLEYIDCYKDIPIDAFYALLEIDDPPIEYRNAVRELFYVAGQDLPELITQAKELEEENSSTS